MFEKTNFIISGFAKSGSTTLFDMLNADPLLSMSSPKEPNFFNQTPVTEKSLKEYHDLWTVSNDPGAMYGEGSVLYGQRHSYPHVAEELYQYNPDLKFIFIARDPISQVRSHLQEQMKWTSKKMPPEQEVRNDPLYLFTAMYNWQIEPFLSRFGRENIHALTFESLMKAPEPEVNKIYDFLGLANDPNETNSRELVWSNKTSGALRYSSLHILMEKIGVASLGRMIFPHSIRALFYPISRAKLPSVVFEPETVEWLKQELRSDSEKFLETFNLDGSSWTVLQDS